MKSTARAGHPAFKADIVKRPTYLIQAELAFRGTRPCKRNSKLAFNQRRRDIRALENHVGSLMNEYEKLHSETAPVAETDPETGTERPVRMYPCAFVEADTTTGFRSPRKPPPAPQASASFGDRFKHQLTLEWRIARVMKASFTAATYQQARFIHAWLTRYAPPGPELNWLYRKPLFFVHEISITMTEGTYLKIDNRTNTEPDATIH